MNMTRPIRHSTTVIYTGIFTVCIFTARKVYRRHTENSEGSCCLMSLEAKKIPSRYTHFLWTSTHASSTAFSFVKRSSHNAASSWNSCERRVSGYRYREHGRQRGRGRGGGGVVSLMSIAPCMTPKRGITAKGTSPQKRYTPLEPLHS